MNLRTLADCVRDSLGRLDPSRRGGAGYAGALKAAELLEGLGEDLDGVDVGKLANLQASDAGRRAFERLDGATRDDT